MTYEEAKEYLAEIARSGIILGLEPMQALLKRLGNPQDQLQFIHIAGTNGKGSTLAFISTILKCAGYTVGRYSSPRVFDYDEFVQVNGENIEREAFSRLTAQVKAAIDSMEIDGIGRPTLFEVETAIGFLYFIEKKCDVVVLECGMGGRDDATNIVENVICNILTPIGMDHMGFLGNTLEEITECKAGIIKNTAPVCVGRQEECSYQVIQRVCEEKGASMYCADSAGLHVYEDMEYAEDGAPLIHYDYKDIKDIRIRMIGRYQLDNASLAIEAAKALDASGMKITDEQIKAGLAEAVWHGRFETIASKPRVILDGAHNPHGMIQLKKSLEYYFAGKRIIGIMGVLADKAYDEECEMMAPLFARFFTVTPPNNPRALEAEQLAAVLRKYHKDVKACDSIQEAVDAAMETAGEDDIIMIFGSLSYIGEAASVVRKKNSKKDLAAVRQQLDQVDQELVKLYTRRMDLCKLVAESKLASSKPVRDIARENKKLEMVKAMVKSGGDKKNVEEMFRMLMAASRKYQYQMLDEMSKGNCRLPFEIIDELETENCRVVYTGVEGAFAHEATMKYFGRDVTSFHVSTFEESMNALSGGRADFAVIPIENSSAGVVADVYDLLVKCDNYIVDEFDLPVIQSLLVVPGTKLEEIETVYSHPQGISQCNKFLNEHKEINTISMSNTALAAKKVAEEGIRSHAAIASTVAADLYGLETLISPLNHNLANMTRFAVITNRKVARKDAQHISICFECEHDPGSLYRLMSHIIYNNLNMIKLESRPVPGQTWEYRFFMNFDGNFNQSSVRNALTGISEEAVSFKILGSF
ncbi:MAG: prephenate dehydratase domain-containing protein [Lachnospiraceae bacterium]